MKSFEDGHDALKKILLQTYHEKKKPELSDRWQANVMQRVRNLAPLQSKSGLLAQFEEFVWRLAPVASLLIIALTMILLNFNFIPEHTLLASLIIDAEEITISQLLPR